MAYAAPEQWIGTRAAELDGRTDLYALGGVLFEMLTGQCAFDAENYHGWAQLHMHTPPPAPSTRRHDLRNWRGLDELVMKMMAKECNERPQNVAELLQLIDTVSYVPSRTTVTAPVEADLWGATAVYVPTSGPQAVVPQAAAQQPSAIYPPTGAQEAATSLQVPTQEPPSGSTFPPSYIPGKWRRRPQRSRRCVTRFRRSGQARDRTLRACRRSLHHCRLRCRSHSLCRRHCGRGRAMRRRRTGSQPFPSRRKRLRHR